MIHVFDNIRETPFIDLSVLQYCRCQYCTRLHFCHYSISLNHLRIMLLVLLTWNVSLSRHISNTFGHIMRISLFMPFYVAMSIDKSARPSELLVRSTAPSRDGFQTDVGTFKIPSFKYHQLATSIDITFSRMVAQLYVPTIQYVRNSLRHVDVTKLHVYDSNIHKYRKCIYCSISLCGAIAFIATIWVCWSLHTSEAALLRFRHISRRDYIAISPDSRQVNERKEQQSDITAIGPKTPIYRNSSDPKENVISARHELFLN